MTAATGLVPPSLSRRTLLTAQREPPPLARGVDALWDSVAGAALRRRRSTAWAMRLGQEVERQRRSLAAMSDALLQEDIEALSVRARKRQASTVADDTAALSRLAEVARRSLGLQPRVEQLACAAALLRGSLVELPTGEGKTLAAALAAAALGWRGKGTHVLTANEYLARRDAGALAPLYERAGVRVGVVQESEPVARRRQAYRCDVTYLTARQAAADFLRDQLSLAGVRSLSEALLADGLGAGRLADALVTRGLEAAIVDEADDALLDNANAPLILTEKHSEAAEDELHARAAAEAVSVARALVEGRHYRFDESLQEVRLTKQGERAVEELAALRDGLCRSARRARELVVLALESRRKTRAGVEYVVRDNALTLVDEATGRLAPDRAWREGLHQVVEAQEGLTPSPLRRTLARISFQRFFRLYRLLSGVTATAWEARDELWRIYRVPVVRLPSHKPCARIIRKDVVYPTAARRDDAVVAVVKREHQRGRPLLIAASSVEACHRLSAALERAGVQHQRLSAVESEREAEIVACAGRCGSVTVATNMAGRGTDIVLDQDAKRRGGLLVIMAERQRSRRLDRQLFGRCARRGDPGEAAPLLSLEDDALTRRLRPWERSLARLLVGGRESDAWLLRWLIARAQRRASRQARRGREAVLRNDAWLEEHLGFAQLH
ncbi:MAG: hypothetical protein D6824_03850 [Planctomycetota bacterium]|nr:MAG: hypothetical protein D6824_03850 [Planctomycetota bacterium]